MHARALPGGPPDGQRMSAAPEAGAGRRPSGGRCRGERNRGGAGAWSFPWTSESVPLDRMARRPATVNEEVVGGFCTDCSHRPVCGYPGAVEVTKMAGCAGFGVRWFDTAVVGLRALAAAKESGVKPPHSKTKRRSWTNLSDTKGDRCDGFCERTGRRPGQVDGADGGAAGLDVRRPGDGPVSAGGQAGARATCWASPTST